MQGRFLRLSVCVLLLAFLCACRDTDDGLPGPYSQSIGREGGTIADPAGATLVVPAGALAQETEITVTCYQDTVDFGTEHPVLAGALFGVKLEPEGLAFAAPVTLQLSPITTLVEGNVYPAFWYDAAASKWVQTGHAAVAAGAAYVEATIDHFSTYGIFDMPYDVLDDFDEFVAEDGGLYAEGTWGDMYGALHIAEEESFVGPDQYYNGCCYMRAGAEMTIQYTYQGRPHTGYWTEGATTESDCYTLSCSYSDDTLSYTIDLTVYLSCSMGESNIWIASTDNTLEAGESTQVYGMYLCGENAAPISGRIFTFSLEGPGRLSRTTAVTDETGEAGITYTAAGEGTAVITAAVEGCTCGAQLDLNPLIATITVGDQPAPQWSGRLTVDCSLEWTMYTTDYSDEHKVIEWEPEEYGYQSFEGSVTVDFTLDSVSSSDSGFCATGRGTAQQTASLVYHDYTTHSIETNTWEGEVKSTFDDTSENTFSLTESRVPAAVSDIQVQILTCTDDPNQALVIMDFGSDVPSDRSFFYRFTSHYVHHFHSDRWHYLTGSATSDNERECDVTDERSSLSFRVNMGGPTLEEGAYLPTANGIFLPESWPTESIEAPMLSIAVEQTADLILARIASE